MLEVGESGRLALVQPLLQVSLLLLQLSHRLTHTAVGGQVSHQP